SASCSSGSSVLPTRTFFCSFSVFARPQSGQSPINCDGLRPHAHLRCNVGAALDELTFTAFVELRSLIASHHHHERCGRRPPAPLIGRRGHARPARPPPAGARSRDVLPSLPPRLVYSSTT